MDNITPELKSIADLCQQQLRYEHDLATLQAQMDTVSDRLKTLSESTIPDAMMAIGMEEFTLSTGEKVSVKKFYSASISQDQLSSVLIWLRDNGHGDIIKNEVKVQFGKGDDDLAIETAKLLREKGLVPEQKTFVHPQTLKSFVKENMESGKDFPQELFGVYVGNKTKITPAKK